MVNVSSGHHSAGPEPTIMPITKLAARVLEGEILLPRYQRSFVWTAPQVLKLLDSVLRNYPIGSVLLWRTTERLSSENTVADLNISQPRDGREIHYILDGHQRLASIIGALYSGRGIWEISYDLEEKRFFHPSLDAPSASHTVPLREVVSPPDLFGIAADLPTALRHRVTELYHQFTNYQVPVVTLDEVTPEDTARIFERINSTGTAMTIVELARAGTWRPDFDLQEEIDRVLSVVDTKDFGQIDSKCVLRMITAAADLGFETKDIQPLQALPKKELHEAVFQAGKAAERAVDFLSTQLRIPSAAALPNHNQFAVLVEILRQAPKPSSGQYTALHKWFWLTAGGDYFKGWSSAQMAADTESIREFATGESTQVQTSAPLPRSALWTNTRFAKNNTVSKLLGLLLSYEEPLDLNTGQRIDVGRALSWQNDKEYHHFFPKAFLKRQGSADANVCANLIMLSSISNIWISDRPPSEYLRDLRDLEGEEALRIRLRTCLIEEDAYQAALRDDYDTFLSARSESLHNRLMELIQGSEAPNRGNERMEMPR